MTAKHLSRAFISFIFIAMLAGQGGWSDDGANLDKYPVRFAVLGDRTGGHVPGIFGKIVEEVERMKPDFVMTVGDLIEGYTEDTVVLKAEWEEFDSLIAPLSMPIYLMSGNHDITSAGMLDMYKRFVGEPNYSFDHRGIHFTILENGRWDSSDELPLEHINWLINDLENNKDAPYKMVFMHVPYWEESTMEGKPDTLHSLFANYGVDAVFTGHYHVYFTGRYDDIIYTGVGSSGGGTDPGPTGLMYHFVWVTVDDKEIAIAPIKMGAVLPWDEVTAEESNFVYEAKQKCLSFNSGFELIHDKGFSHFGYTVDISNPSDMLTLEDTVRWDIPSGWSVMPISIPVTIPPGETVSREFVIATDGTIYPAPEVSVKFPYSEGKETAAVRGLPVQRFVTCEAVEKKPKIDGRLKEDIWNNPVTRLFAPDGGEMAIDSVNFYFAHDDENLYLAAYCHDADIAKIVESVKEHDGSVYGEDCVGYFFCPDFDSMFIYQVYFNPRGYVFDQKIWLNEDGDYRSDREWNGDYKVKTHKGDDFWSIEAAIPAALFGVSLEKGAKWGLNFRRKQKRFDSAADWMIPIEYEAEYLGRLVIQ